MKHQDLPVVLHNDKRGLLTIEDGKLEVLQLSRDGNPPKRLLSCPLQYLLRAVLADAQQGHQRRLDLNTLIRKKDHVHLSSIHVLVEPINVPEAEEWVATAMSSAYEGVKPFRKVLMLVNPIGGKGKARKVVRETVLPIFQAAGCHVDMRETTHRFHAEELCKDIRLEFDVIATVSGDGLAYEVLNGLTERPDATKALKTPVVPIPTGSANALCLNLLGPDDFAHVPLACLNVIKGRTLPLDLCSVLMLPSNERRWSFMGNALGLMVDLDIGTENLRWMGSTRFTVGFVRGLVSQKKLACRLKMKVLETDKVHMARVAREKVASRSLPTSNGTGSAEVRLASADPAGPSVPTTVSEANGENHSESNGHTHDPPKSTEEEVIPQPLEPAKALEPDDSWMVIETDASHSKASRSNGKGKGLNNDWVEGEGIIYVYAGTQRWVDKSLLQWPIATAGEGAINVVVQSVMSRGAMAGLMSDAEKGETYWVDAQHYYKGAFSAYVAENLDKAKQPQFTIDGEAFEWDSFHVEVHPGIATTLSPDGHFFTPDFLKKHEPRT